MSVFSNRAVLLFRLDAGCVTVVPYLKNRERKKKRGNGPLPDFLLEGSGGGLLQTGYALRRLLKLLDVKQDSHLKVKAGFVMMLFQAGLRNLYENWAALQHFWSYEKRCLHYLMNWTQKSENASHFVIFWVDWIDWICIEILASQYKTYRYVNFYYRQEKGLALHSLQIIWVLLKPFTLI